MNKYIVLAPRWMPSEQENQQEDVRKCKNLLEELETLSVKARVEEEECLYSLIINRDKNEQVYRVSYRNAMVSLLRIVLSAVTCALHQKRKL